MEIEIKIPSLLLPASMFLYRNRHFMIHLNSNSNNPCHNIEQMLPMVSWQFKHHKCKHFHQKYKLVFVRFFLTEQGPKISFFTWTFLFPSEKIFTMIYCSIFLLDSEGHKKILLIFFYLRHNLFIKQKFRLESRSSEKEFEPLDIFEATV